MAKLRWKGIIPKIIFIFTLCLILMNAIYKGGDRTYTSAWYNGNSWKISANHVQFFAKYRCDCKVVYYPNTSRMKSTLISVINNSDCVENFTAASSMDNFLKTVEDSDSSTVECGIALNAPDPSKPNKIEAVLFSDYSDQFNNPSYTANIAFAYLSQGSASNISLSLGAMEMPPAMQPQRSGGDTVNAIGFSFSIVCVVLHAFIQMLQFRESKMMALLSISGASYPTMWGAFFLQDVIETFPIILLSAVFDSCVNGYQSNFICEFLLLIGPWISHILMIYAIIPLIYHISVGLYVGILILGLSLMGSFIPLIFGLIPNNYQILNRLLMIFLPSASSGFLFNNVDRLYYTYSSFNWGQLNRSFYVSSIDVLEYSWISVIVYGVLFVINEALMPRNFGKAPLGWRNIFKPIAWKRLFTKKAEHEENYGEGSFMEIENLNKVYSGKVSVQALNNVSFNLQKSQVILLIGPNGSGKTTLLNTMTGFISADSGKVKIYGKEAICGFSEIQDYLGICFQENIFFNKLSVRDHLKFFGSIRGSQNAEEEIGHLADELGITELLDSEAGALSGGQKRKLCIAMALIGKPSLMVLDEPTAGIDVATRQSIWKALASFKDMTSIISSHSLEEGESVSTNIFVMREGHIMFNGSANQLRTKYHCGYKLEAIGENINMLQLQEACMKYIPDIVIDSGRNGSLIFTKCNKMSVFLRYLEQQMKQLGIRGYTITVEQLEHVLIRMITEDE